MRLNSHGVIHFVLILLAALGIIAYFLVTSSFPFKDRLFSLLYPKPKSYAQEGLPKAVPDQILLKLKPGVSDKTKDKLLKKYHLEVSKTIDGVDIFVLKVPEKARDRLIKALNKNPLVDFAQEDSVVQLNLVTNDPGLPTQWGMFKINAASSLTSAWNVTTSSRKVKIAILDSGIDSTHPDLSKKVVKEINFSDSFTSSDVNGHGTHVAGIAAADTNNAKGVAGVGYDSALMNVKVSGDFNVGSQSWMISGISWAADSGANVINMSSGSVGSSSPALESAVNYAWNKNVVLVASAGNNGGDIPNVPAYLTNVIAVAATDENDNKDILSNYGASWVDVAAPGTNIYSTTKTSTGISSVVVPRSKSGSYAFESGTSMAAPHVAGEAALIWAKGDCKTNVCVRRQIEYTTDQINGTGTYWKYGRINAYKALTTPPPPLDTAAPQTAVINPTAGVTVSGTVDVAASASDNIGVTKVDFYIDDQLFATDLTSSYLASWDTTNTLNTNHTLYTKAYDAGGNVGTSAVITVTVNNPIPDITPPITSIDSPIDGSTVSGNVDILASASDNVAVSSVIFFVDGIFLGEDTTAPYTMSWDTTKETNASHVLTTQATDSSGNIGQSAAVTVSVNNVTTCATNCAVCTTTTTCGTVTYDTCVDNLGQLGATLCQNSATGFRCYASENNNCASSPAGSFPYSCSTCPVPTPIPTPTPVSSLCPTGLISYWKLNETAGATTALDSQDSNNGTVVGTVNYSTGKINNALTLNGGFGYIQMNPASFPQGSSPRTICGWGKANAIDGAWQLIFSYGNRNNGNQDMEFGRYGSQLACDAGTGNDCSFNNFWSAGVWNHVCLSYDGTTAKLYGNGALLVSKPQGWNTAGPDAYMGWTVFTSPLDGASKWNGQIDEVGIWNRALTDTEVSQLYNGGNGLTCGI